MRVAAVATRQCHTGVDSGHASSRGTTLPNTWLPKYTLPNAFIHTDPLSIRRQLVAGIPLKMFCSSVIRSVGSWPLHGRIPELIGINQAGNPALGSPGKGDGRVR